jgi:hypothetical protein
MTIVIECKQIGGSLACGGFHKCPETIGWENDAPRNTVSLISVPPCLSHFHASNVFLETSLRVLGTSAFFQAIISLKTVPDSILLLCFFAQSISPHFGNHEIEYYTVRRNSVIPCRSVMFCTVTFCNSNVDYKSHHVLQKRRIDASCHDIDVNCDRYVSIIQTSSGKRVDESQTTYVRMHLVACIRL